MINTDDFIFVYNKYKNEIFFYILKYIHHRETAEDIFQDCFEKVIDYFNTKQFNPDYIRPLLYTIAHNLCINFISRKKKIDFTVLNDNTATQNSNDQIDQIILKDLNDKIHTILDKFSPEMKSIFLLKKEMGMSYAEVAENLNISERTARRKIKKVIEEIMEELKRNEYI